MTEIEHLTIQNAALLAVVRGLVKTHPDQERLRAVVQSKVASYQATSLAAGPQEWRDTFRTLVTLLLEGPDQQDQQA